VLLFAAIRATQEVLDRRVDRRGVAAATGEPILIDLDRFAAGLTAGWRNGESARSPARPIAVASRSRSGLPRSTIAASQTGVLGAVDAASPAD
jgi:hypothetical protein